MPTVEEAKAAIRSATSVDDLANTFRSLFALGKKDKKESGDYGLKKRGIKAREALNAKCREIIERVNSPLDLTEDEIDTLRQYSGNGGLAEGSQYEYYTPQHVAEGCWDALKAQGFSGGNVLDPSTGAGMFEATKNPAAVMTGCDLDATSSRVAQLLHPNEKIETKPFEQLAVETPDNTFDAVITNVPFGSSRGAYKHIDPDFKNEKKIERYFILRSLHKLKPGGLAVFVCPTNIVGAKANPQFSKWRAQVSYLAEFMGAHKLPSKTFGNQGTDTVVDVVVFRKHPKDLLDKIDSIPTDTLKAANVVWDEFIAGRYWMGEGKRFIMGKYTPRVDGDRWSREVVDGDVDDAGLKQRLAARFDSRIDWQMLDAAEPVVRVFAEGDRRIMNGSEFEFTHGQWVKVSAVASTPIDKEKFGASTLDELKGILEDPKSCLKLSAKQAFFAWKSYPEIMPELPKKAIEFAMRQPKIEYHEQLWRGSLIGGMIGQYQAHVDAGSDNEQDRFALQEMVASEVMTYGHPANNRGLSVIGEDSRMFGLFKNALDPSGNYSDLLSGTLVGTDSLRFDPESLQSIVEYLFFREGLTSITLEDVQAMYAGSAALKTLGDIATSEDVAVTPDGLIMPLSRYCAGDIYPKLDAMQLALASETDPRLISCYQRQIDAIQKKAKLTPLHEVDFTLQQKWVPRAMIRDYLKDSGYDVRYGVMREVEQEDPLTGEMQKKLGFVEDYDTPFGKWQVGSMAGRGYNQKVDFNKKLSGFPLNLEKYLNGGNILDRVAMDDEGRRNGYMEKKKALESGLTSYISGHPDVETVLASYNRKMNGYVPFGYDEGDLGLKGLSGQMKLHSYQNAAVRRLSEEGSGILAFNVGLGKTTSALALARYNTQMGRSKRTCIVVPNSVLSNWYHEAKALYGNMDHALFVGLRPIVGDDGKVEQEPVLDEHGQPKKGKDGSIIYQDVLKSDNDAEAVWDAMWSIPQSNSSLVIMTQDRFGQIPLKKESKDAYATLMAADMANSKAKLDDRKKGKRGYKGAVAEEGMEGRLADDGTKKRGDFPYFEDMGFTDVIVDEAHGFKNGVAASSNYDRKYYLPNTAPSQRALDMAMKLNHLKSNNNGRGVYFLTATPITNSLNEVYTMLNHVVPREEFTNRGIYTLDDFLATFGEFTSVEKTLATGELRSGEGLTGFRNMDGLRDLFFKYVNMKDATQVKELSDAMPGVEKSTESVGLTDYQQQVYDVLVDQYKKKKRPVFAIMRDMDKITTDPDLYHNLMTWHFPAEQKQKVEALLKDLPASVKFRDRPEPGDPEFDDELPPGKQKIVEMTISLADKLKTSIQGDTFVVVTHAGYEEEILSNLSKHKIPEEDISHPITAKYAKLIANCKKEMDAGGKQIIFSEEKGQHKKIVRLIVHQIPALRNKIGIINATEAKGNALQKISDSYNAGTLIYIIANRKAEVGVNLQKGTTAIHHLTYPWTKASLTQREGRGVRQGNEAEKVSIYYYQAKGTIDMMRLDLIEHKGALIDDIANGQGNRADNGEADPEMAALMFAKDPEEARRKIKEQLEQKKQQEAERLRTSLINQFTAYASNMQTLATLDAQLTEKRAELTQKIEALTLTIAQSKARGQEQAEGSTLRIEYAKRIQRDTETLAKRQNDIETLETRFAAIKTKAEGNAKRAATSLRAAAKNGTLPIDASLLDHPENVLISQDGGAILSKGDIYEIRKFKEDRATIIRVKDVANGMTVEGVVVPYKGFVFETLVKGQQNSPSRVRADTYGMVPLSQFIDNKSNTEPMPVRCSYTAEELELQAKLATPIRNISDITAMGKEIFAKYYDKLNLGPLGYHICRDKEGIVFIRPYYNMQREVIYPDTTDENLRKIVADYALGKRRVGEYTTSSSEKEFFTMFFGSNWEAEISKYGTTLTQAEVIRDLESLWRAAAKENGFDTDIEIANGENTSWISSTWRNAVESIAKRGDNLDEIKSWAREYQESVMSRILEMQEKRKTEAEKAKLEELRNHPDFKEIPAEVVAGFAGLDIVVKVNTGNLVIPGFRGKKGTPVDPFALYLFQDKKGFNGRLRIMKEMLKGQFSAKFFQNAGGEFNGAWWYVDSKKDLTRIYELLA